MFATKHDFFRRVLHELEHSDTQTVLCLSSSAGLLLHKEAVGSERWHQDRNMELPGKLNFWMHFYLLVIAEIARIDGIKFAEGESTVLKTVVYR